jgi:signal transduction histidine kinase
MLKSVVSRKTDVRLGSVELASLRRQLKQEVILREGVQKSLTSSKRHYDELLEKSARMQEHLRRLSHEILSAHEEERKKISRELHDEIGQILTAVNVKLAALRVQSANNATGLEKKIAVTQRLVERSMNTVHRFARQLRPPLLDDLGLIPALRSFMKEFTKRTRIVIHFTAFAEIERLDSDKRTVLFRVVQEALTNVDKHAR